MPRLRDNRSGVVVNVDDDTATQLGGTYYEAVSDKNESSAKSSAPRSRTAKKSDDK